MWPCASRLPCPPSCEHSVHTWQGEQVAVVESRPGAVAGVAVAVAAVVIVVVAAVVIVVVSVVVPVVVEGVCVVGGPGVHAPEVNVVLFRAKLK